jgi:L-lactate dehydrogenase (cytochrome)
VNQDRGITRRIVQHAEARGIKALFITVDAPQLGHREKVTAHSILMMARCSRGNICQDMRMKFEADQPSEMSEGKDVDRSHGAARAISVCIVYLPNLPSFLFHPQTFIDPGLHWGDIAWFKSITNSTCLTQLLN